MDYKSNSAIVADVAGLFSKAKESVTAKAVQAQSSIEDLNSLLAVASRINVASVSLPKYSLEKRLQVVSRFITKLNETPQPRGCKASVDKLRNELISIKEGLTSGEKLTASDLVITQAPVVIEAVKEKIAYANRLVEAARSSMTGQETAMTEIDRLLAEELEVKQVLQQVNKESTKAISNIKTKPFVVARMPVVPLGILDKRLAESNGFAVSTLQGYLVFHNQVVIGINKNLLQQSKTWNRGQKKIKMSDIVQDILEMIELKANKKYALIDTRSYSSPKAGSMGVSWYWVMPMRQANTFARLFRQTGGVSSIKMEGWGLAV